VKTTAVFRYLLLITNYYFSVNRFFTKPFNTNNFEPVKGYMSNISF